MMASKTVTAPRSQLPQCIKDERVLFGLDVTPLYIQFHHGLAMKELTRLAKVFNIRVHSHELVSDGWMDGMRVVQAVVETKCGTLLKLVWHDGNQGFMKQHANSGGASILFESDLA